MKGKKEGEKKKAIKKRAWRTRDETAKYCFSILLAGDDGETRCEQCFQKKYITPSRHPRLRHVDLYFFHPCPAPPIALYLALYGKRRACKFRNENIGRK